MSMLETYILLFTDTLVSNLAFNTSAEIVIYSMKVFGFYKPYIVVVVSTLSFMIAGYINYILGIISYKILAPLKSEEGTADNIDKIRYNKYILLILMLSAVPFFGKFIMLFAGFCRVRLLMAISVTTCARFIYYSLFMLI